MPSTEKKAPMAMVITRIGLIQKKEQSSPKAKAKTEQETEVRNNGTT